MIAFTIDKDGNRKTIYTETTKARMRRQLGIPEGLSQQQQNDWWDAQVKGYAASHPEESSPAPSSEMPKTAA